MTMLCSNCFKTLKSHSASLPRSLLRVLEWGCSKRSKSYTSIFQITASRPVNIPQQKHAISQFWQKMHEFKQIMLNLAKICINLNKLIGPKRDTPGKYRKSWQVCVFYLKLNSLVVHVHHYLSLKWKSRMSTPHRNMASRIWMAITLLCPLPWNTNTVSVTIHKTIWFYVQSELFLGANWLFLILPLLVIPEQTPPPQWYLEAMKLWYHPLLSTCFYCPSWIHRISENQSAHEQ